MAFHGSGSFLGFVRFEFPNRAAADSAAEAVINSGVVRPDLRMTFADVLDDMWGTFIEDTTENDPQAIHEYATSVQGFFQPDMDTFADIVTPYLCHLFARFTDENGNAWEWSYDPDTRTRTVQQLISITTSNHTRLVARDLALDLIYDAILDGAPNDGIARLAKILLTQDANPRGLAMLADDPDPDVARAASQRVVKAAL